MNLTHSQRTALVGLCVYGIDAPVERRTQEALEKKGLLYGWRITAEGAAMAAKIMRNMADTLESDYQLNKE
jgi:hypothetical protein